MSEIINVPMAQQRSLDVVTAEIRTIQEQARRMALGYCIEIGRRLTEAKDMVAHGEWGTYLKEELGFSQSTANNHMRLFEAYGADQMSLTGAALKSQAFGNLSYTQALALLAIPEGERESFVQETDLESMSSRELQQAIKDRQAAEERAKCAEADAEGARQETFAAKDQAAKLKAAFETEEDLRKRAEQQLKEFLVAQDQNAKALDKAQKAADKAKADAEAARKRLESMKSDPAVIAEIGGKAAEEAKQKAEEAFQTERDKLTAEAEKAAKAAEAAQTEAERLRKELALASPEAAEFKLLFGQLQSTFNQAMDVLLKVKASNEEQAGKLRAAMSALLAAWTRKIGGGGE